MKRCSQKFRGYRSRIDTMDVDTMDVRTGVRPLNRAEDIHRQTPVDFSCDV